MEPGVFKEGLVHGVKVLKEVKKDKEENVSGGVAT